MSWLLFELNFCSHNKSQDNRFIAFLKIFEIEIKNYPTGHPEFSRVLGFYIYVDSHLQTLSNYIKNYCCKKPNPQIPLSFSPIPSTPTSCQYLHL